VRRLRVLSGHPQLGQPGAERAEFEGAQAFVDAGLAEWIARPADTERATPVETTTRAGAPEKTTPRDSPRRGPAGRETRRQES
jgi:hypothetical protein